MSDSVAAVVLLSGGGGLEVTIGLVALRYCTSTVLLIPTSKRVLGRRTGASARRLPSVTTAAFGLSVEEIVDYVRLAEAAKRAPPIGRKCLGVVLGVVSHVSRR